MNAKKIGFGVVLCIAVGGTMGVAGALPSSQPTMQQQEQRQSATTRFEQFSTRTGGVTIKEIVDLDTVTTRYGELKPQAVRLENTRTGEVVKGLILRYSKTSDRIGRVYSSVLDEEEVVELAKSLKYLREQTPKLVREAEVYTEMTYTSVSGFSAGVYISVDGQNSARSFFSLQGESVFPTSSEHLPATVEEALSALAWLD